MNVDWLFVGCSLALVVALGLFVNNQIELHRTIRWFEDDWRRYRAENPLPDEEEDEEE